MPFCKETTVIDSRDGSNVMDHVHKKRHRESALLPSLPSPGNPSGESLASFIHDIKDHNYSILLGTDLLFKFWEELKEHLAEPEGNEELENRDSFDDICTTIPAVVTGIRKSAHRIEEIIDELKRSGIGNPP
jgi:hypothetical protein